MRYAEIEKLDENFDANEYYGNIADELKEREEYGNRRIQATGSEGNVAGYGGGGEVLSEQGADTSRRGAEDARQPGIPEGNGIQGGNPTGALPEGASGREVGARATATEGPGEGSQRPEQAPDPVQRGETGINPGDARRNGNRSDNMEQGEEVNCKLSEEVNEFGKPFVISSNGTTDFGYIDPESGLAALPIKLSLGENYKDENGDDHGYGYLHIDAGHRREILQNGFSSVEEFVEAMAKNYTDIKEGAKIGKNQTYLLEVYDKHNNTLFIQLSRDGKYWSVNSAGIFKKKYSRRKPKVYSRPAVGSGKDTYTTEVNSGKNEGATAPAGNSSETSVSKVNTLSTEKQTKGVESSGLQQLGVDNLPIKEDLAKMSYEDVEQTATDYDLSIEERYDAMIEPLETEKDILENKRRNSQETKRLKAINNEIANLERRQEEERLTAGKYFAEELRSRWNRDMTPEQVDQAMFMDEADALAAQKAQEIAAAEAETNTNPTEAQKKAGNYKMGHFEPDGFDDFGPIFTKFKGDSQGAIRLLSQIQDRGCWRTSS